MDGSALPYVEMLREAGVKRQSKERTYLCVEREVTLKDGVKSITVRPYAGFRVAYEIDFPHPLVGRQRLDLVVTPARYAREIAFARTFGFYREVEELLKKGLIRGGSLENAVVLSETGVMNGPLRASDEFVRHKTLDLIGDV